VSIGSYFASKHRQRERAIAGLRALADELHFELVPVADEVMDEAGAQRAADALRAQEIDFLLVQNSACSMGDQLLRLLEVAPRLGLWSTPDPAHEGEIQIHSFVAMSQYASILKRYIRARDLSYKWFYGHVDSEMFRRRFAITVRALTALKNLARARVAWIGGLSPGFHDMVFDERALRARLGVQVESFELMELVERAKEAAGASAA